MASGKRLIDANRALEIVYEHGIAHPNAYYLTNYAMAILREAPTVDAVEVVRCEKCKHAIWDEETKLWRCVESAEYDEEMGGYFGVCEYHYGDFFCFYGKRKDGDGNAHANL